MARIIPDRPRGRPGKALLAFYRLLKRLPDEFTAWLSLDEGGGPQVFLLWRERHGFLIQIAETTQELAESAMQRDFITGGDEISPDDLGRGERESLQAFMERVEAELGPLEGRLPIRKLVVFPNVREGTVDEVVMRQGEDEVSYLGLHQCELARFSRRLEALAKAAIPETGLLELRRRFTPESVVPGEFVMRDAPDRHTAAKLGDAFLDFDQEWCVKNDLELLPEQSAVVGEDGMATRLVTGVAGSGKSLVLLYRALLSAKLHPGARVLVLTHNRPLRFELERRSRRLSEIGGEVECRTFFQWASRSMNGFGAEVWSPQRTQRLVESLRPRREALQRLSTAYLMDELGWMKDHRLLDKEAYLSADRGGRGTRLSAGQREEIWGLFGDYQRELDRLGVIDWHNVALRFHEAAVVKGRLEFPVFDAVFVDEAQFFAKSWFEVVRAALKPGGHLFLAADPTQGFLRRRQSWISAGIEVRGRTTCLRRAYRNTRAILRYARDFYDERRSDTDGEDGLNVPDDAMLAAISEAGEAPVVIRVANAQDELARAVNEVARLRDTGLMPGTLVILDSDPTREHSLRRALESELGDGNVWDLKEGPMPEGAFCGMTTLNAATGLEAPVVMLLGIDRLIEAEDDPRLGDDERAELRRDHTRQIYMGFTRAGRRLVVLRTMREGVGFRGGK